MSLDQQNKYRDQYRQANPDWRPATEVYAGHVQSRLNTGSRLLDLGCGRGGLVEQLDHPSERVIGVDPDWNSLGEHRLAAARPPMPRVAGLSKELPFSQGCFDVVIASWVLEHLSNPVDDLREIKRLLKPLGSFIFITPNRQHPLIKLNQLSARYESIQRRLVEYFYNRASVDTFPAYYKANSARDLEQLAISAGLQMAGLEFIADPTYFAFSPTFFHFSRVIERRRPADKRIHLVGEMQLAD